MNGRSRHHLIALLEKDCSGAVSAPTAVTDRGYNTPFLGQFKTLLTGPELPVASDVAVPWDIAYFIEFLKPKLGQQNAERGVRSAECLHALVAVLNDRSKLPDLDRFPEWRDQPAVPLDTPWP